MTADTLVATRIWKPCADPVTYGAQHGELDAPLRWEKAERVAVVLDLFLDAVPDDHIARVFAIMALAPHHVFQILTTRPGRMRSVLRSSDFREHVIDHMCWYDNPAEVPRLTWPRPNVWLGASIQDQASADLCIPALLDTPAAVRWLSCDPLLGPVDFDLCGRHGRGSVHDEGPGECANCRPLDGWLGLYVSVDWVVVGGESAHPDWVRSLRDQCQSSGVPCLSGPWAGWAPDERVDVDVSRHSGPEPVATDPRS